MVLRIRESNMSEANKGYSSAVYQALDDDFKDGWSEKVDPVYVSDQVELWLMNTKELYDEIFNNRRKPHSIAYAAMLDLFQDVVDRYDVKVIVTSEMAKQWLKRNGMNYIEVLKPVVSRVEEEREERKSETKESFRRRMRKGLREETYPFESKRDSSYPYFYVLKHGFGPGTIPRGVHVGRVEDYKGYLVVWLDRPLSSDELNEYDIPSETMLRKYLGNDLDYFRSLSGLPEGVHRKRIRSGRSIKESAWVAPDGTKYGKQKRGSSYDYRFSTRELKDMIAKGIAQEIRDSDKAWKLMGGKDSIIGISWNETNGYKSGVLFKGKDGNLYVGNTGVAQVIV